MSLQTRLTALVAAIGADVKNLYATMVTLGTAQSITGQKTFTTEPRWSGSSFVGLSPNSLVVSPFGSRMWADRIRFRTPTTVETSLSATTPSWTTTGALTAAQVKKIVAGLVSNSIGLTFANPGVRITWSGSDLAYSQIRMLMLGWGYSATPFPSVTAIWESSPDGVTWTERGQSTAASNAVWSVIPVNDNIDSQYLRLTLLGNNGTTGMNNQLRTFQAYTARPGDQGGSEANNVPYTWDENRNVTIPGTLNSVGNLTENGNRVHTQGTDIAVSDGGTGASTAAGARTNLNVPQRGYAAHLTAVVAGTPLIVTHNLGTQDVIAQVRDTSSNEYVYLDIINASTNTVSVTSGVSYAANALRIVILPVL